MDPGDGSVVVAAHYLTRCLELAPSLWEGNWLASANKGGKKKSEQVYFQEIPEVKLRKSLLLAPTLGLSSWQVHDSEFYGIVVSISLVICLSLLPIDANPTRMSHSLSLVYSWCLYLSLAIPPVISDLLQTRKLAQSRISDLLGEMCFLSPPDFLCQSRKVAKSFLFANSSLGTGWDGGGTQDHTT